MLWEDNYLAHHGIIGQRWGIRRFQNKDGTLTEEGKKRYSPEIDDKMLEAQNYSKKAKEIKYKEFDRLMTPDAVEKTKEGSCHDQVMLELRELRKMGLDPKALFVMEHAGQQGGMTHSLVYFIKNNKAYWVENAWSNRAGIKEYDSVDAIKREIKKAHKNGEFGNKRNYSSLSFGDFNDKEQKPGETLQELVDHIKWDK